MCLQCIVNAKMLKNDFIPGYALMKSMNSKAYDEWPNGWYGLVEINDPIFVIELGSPFDYIGGTIIGLSNSLDSTRCFIEACSSVGYNYNKHGVIDKWVVNRIRDFLRYRKSKKK